MVLGLSFCRLQGPPSRRTARSLLTMPQDIQQTTNNLSDNLPSDRTPSAASWKLHRRTGNRYNHVTITDVGLLCQVAARTFLPTLLRATSRALASLARASLVQERARARHAWAAWPMHARLSSALYGHPEQTKVIAVGCAAAALSPCTSMASGDAVTYLAPRSSQITHLAVDWQSRRGCMQVGRYLRM